MSARVCRSCQYNVLSEVVTACPNCGAPLPRGLSSGSSGPLVLGLAVLLAAGAGGWVLTRTAEAPPAPPSPTVAPAVPATPVPAATARAVTAGGADAQKVARLIAQLEAPGGDAWAAASELATLADPRAHKALMAAYARRDYEKMAGATAFYARRRPPAYATVLIDLLHASKDLAVAQDLILSKDPKLAEPARAWAAEQGFKLVPSRETPTGVTWTAAP